jgi:hypothetical protein
VASSLGYTSLINAYRRRLIDAMGTIYCNGQKAFKTAVLLGMGAPYTIYYNWVANYPSTAFKVQYTAVVSQTAFNEMAAGTTAHCTRAHLWVETQWCVEWGAGDIDFAALATALTPAQKALVPDGEGVPTIGYGILPVYNVRHQFLPWPLCPGCGRSPAAAHLATRSRSWWTRTRSSLTGRPSPTFFSTKSRYFPTCWSCFFFSERIRLVIKS